MEECGHDFISDVIGFDVGRTSRKHTSYGLASSRKMKQDASECWCLKRCLGQNLKTHLFSFHGISFNYHSICGRSDHHTPQLNSKL